MLKPRVNAIIHILLEHLVNFCAYKTIKIVWKILTWNTIEMLCNLKPAIVGTEHHDHNCFCLKYKNCSRFYWVSYIINYLEIPTQKNYISDKRSFEIDFSSNSNMDDFITSFVREDFLPIRLIAKNKNLIQVVLSKHFFQILVVINYFWKMSGFFEHPVIQ